MSAGLPGADGGELARIRREYESSLSWRLTRPVRAVGRIGRALRPARATDEVPQPPAQDQLDSWLEHFYGDRLAAIDAACAQGSEGPGYAAFRGLDDDLWALLLTQQYELYPHIRRLLPSMPEPELQELWNGRSGLPLAHQSRAFYAKLRLSFERHGERPLADASVLDFGCGWGRLTRYFARDVAPGRLYGCDPVEGILDVCRANRVPATVARSGFLPDRLPFDERFDLAFAFSVFTHLSEEAHTRSLQALHRSLREGGLLIVTIRPPEYLFSCAALLPLVDALGPDIEASLRDPRYLFVPHAADPSHFQQHDQGQIDYGETVITMPYVRERWSRWFKLLEVDLQLEDLHQVILTLRRK
jgi:SAM-dependent methyltransferase